MKQYRGSTVIYQRGSIIVEKDHSDNLVIYMSHTPSNKMQVERADVVDLMKLLKEVKES